MNRKMGFALVGILATALLCGGAWADEAKPAKKLSLKEKERRAAQMENLNDNIKAANEACGTTFKVDIDFDSFQGKADFSPEYTESGRCPDPLDVLYSMCKDSADAKKEIQENIKTVRCTYGGAGKRAAKLEKGVFTYSVDPSSANDADFLKEFLGENL